MAPFHRPPPIPLHLLRQPPSPRLLLSDAREDRYREMVGDNCLSIRLANTDTDSDSLPNKLVFDILLHLAAQDIYETARLVCPKWYHMIHTRYFIHEHLKHTACGLIIQDYNCRKRPVFMAVRLGRIEISDFTYNFRHEVSASCNGLILERDYKRREALYIANPATRQHFLLPALSYEIWNRSPGIAYAVGSMEYKVAVMFPFDDGESDFLRPQFSIVTIGMDETWRYIGSQHLSQFTDGVRIWGDDPIITEGFIHWITENTHIWTLNVESEIIIETPIPRVCRINTERYYLSTGRCLSMLIGCNKFSWEVWVMKSETGEWIKLLNINFEAKTSALEQFEKYGNERDHTFIPVGWLKHEEVLIFAVYGTPACFAVNIQTQETDVFDLGFPCEDCTFVVHKNSLEWL